MKSSLLKSIIPLVLLSFAFLLIYNPLTKFPFTFIVIIFFILICTYLQDKNLNSLNFKPLRSREWRIIILWFLIFELSMDFVFDPLIRYIFKESADYSSFAFLKDNMGKYLLMLMKMWISAAIGEELLFRGFAVAQLKRLVSNKAIIVLVSAMLFCIPHLYQGLAGLLSTFIFGIAFAYLYIRYQNIWVNIIVHGLVDTFFLTLSYLGKLDYYTLSW